MFYLLYEIPNHFTLQSTQVKRTPQDYINEFIIRKLNPLVYTHVQYSRPDSSGQNLESDGV